ncbi:MAG: methyltransferase [Chitinophagaceae bacterium]
MSTTYFKFKKFIIQQDRCAMKVCTDACLFGAWTAERVGSRESGVGRLPVVGVFTNHQPGDIIEGTVSGQSSMHTVLDIGSGTGLLALMLAQKKAAMIDTIEIDADAYRQAAGNVSASPWSSRIRVIHADVKSQRFPAKYNLIISNPPFFESQLRSPVPVTNTARHDTGLRWEELISVVGENLRADGLFAVLLPYSRSDHFITLAGSAGLHLHTAVYVKQSSAHSFFRTMLFFEKQPCFTIEYEELVIKEDGRYSQQFTSLLKDYYLNL